MKFIIDIGLVLLLIAFWVTDLVYFDGNVILCSIMLGINVLALILTCVGKYLSHVLEKEESE